MDVIASPGDEVVGAALEVLRGNGDELDSEVDVEGGTEYENGGPGFVV